MLVTAVRDSSVVVRRLLADTNAKVFNLDKCGYASDLSSIELVLTTLGKRLRGATTDAGGSCRCWPRRSGVAGRSRPGAAPGGESLWIVDRWPEAFISSNVNGTFYLLVVRSHCSRCRARQFPFPSHQHR